MRTYYVIRRGWNAANQSSVGTPRNPANRFESNELALVGIVEARTAEQAIETVNCTCYNNQHVFAETNPRKLKGLTQAIRDYRRQCV